MVKIARLVFLTDEIFNKRDSEKLRNYFSQLYQEESLPHNHDGQKKDVYRLPLLQYKIIDGHLNIFGINQAVPILADKFIKVKEIIIDDQKITHFKTQLDIKYEDFHVDKQLFAYSFDSLWLPINQTNHQDFVNKKINLNHILQKNIQTNLNGLGIAAEQPIIVKGDFRQTNVTIKNVDCLAFYGKFVTNVKMPSYFSVGRNRAIGYGSVIRKNVADSII